MASTSGTRWTDGWWGDVSFLSVCLWVCGGETQHVSVNDRVEKEESVKKLKRKSLVMWVDGQLWQLKCSLGCRFLDGCEWGGGWGGLSVGCCCGSISIILSSSLVITNISKVWTYFSLFLHGDDLAVFGTWDEIQKLCGSPSDKKFQTPKYLQNDKYSC